MKKKTYIAPACIVFTVAPIELLEGSPEPPIDPGTDTNEAISREFIHDANAWDEW